MSKKKVASKKNRKPVKGPGPSKARARAKKPRARKPQPAPAPPAEATTPSPEAPVLPVTEPEQPPVQEPGSSTSE